MNEQQIRDEAERRWPRKVLTNGRGDREIEDDNLNKQEGFEACAQWLLSQQGGTASQPEGKGMGRNFIDHGDGIIGYGPWNELPELIQSPSHPPEVKENEKDSSLYFTEEEINDLSLKHKKLQSSQPKPGTSTKPEKTAEEMLAYHTTYSLYEIEREADKIIIHPADAIEAIKDYHAQFKSQSPSLRDALERLLACDLIDDDDYNHDNHFGYQTSELKEAIKQAKAALNNNTDI